MKEQLKAILQQGCKISYSFKKSRKSWISEISISILAAFENRPTTVFIFGAELAERFPIDKLDEALDVFIAKVFSKENKWFKSTEAKTHFAEQGYTMDEDFFEDDSLNRKFHYYRNKLVTEYFDNKAVEEVLSRLPEFGWGAAMDFKDTRGTWGVLEGILMNYPIMNLSNSRADYLRLSSEEKVPRLPYHTWFETVFLKKNAYAAYLFHDEHIKYESGEFTIISESKKYVKSLASKFLELNP